MARYKVKASYLVEAEQWHPNDPALDERLGVTYIGGQPHIVDVLDPVPLDNGDWVCRDDSGSRAAYDNETFHEIFEELL